MQNFVKIGQTVSKILRFFDFQDDAIRHVGFEIFKFLISHQVERSKMHYYTKYHQNRSNGCRDIPFNVFQMATVRHFGFVGHILGLPTTRI